MQQPEDDRRTMSAFDHRCRVQARSPLLRFAAILLVACSAGCVSNRFSPTNLPVELQVPPVENVQEIDLSDFAMLAAGSDTIDRGDVLEVSISAGLSAKDTFTFQVRVFEDGVAKLPVIGDIPLAGMPLQGAEAAIAAACVYRGLYRSPHVTVTMKQQRKNMVTVIGAVKQPGVYALPRGRSDLLAALVAAGSLTEDAGTEVEIRHPGQSAGRIETGTSPALSMPGGGQGKVANYQGNGISAMGHSLPSADKRGPEIIRVNLAAAAKEGTKGYYIDDGGVVMVEKRDPKPVHVLGLVRKPGRYDYPVGEEFRVLDALAVAGGMSSSVGDKVFVIRNRQDGRGPAVIEVSVRKAKSDGRHNLLLAPGDVVSVEKTSATVVLDVLRQIRPAVGASLGTFGVF